MRYRLSDIRVDGYIRVLPLWKCVVTVHRISPYTLPFIGVISLAVYAAIYAVFWHYTGIAPHVRVEHVQWYEAVLHGIFAPANIVHSYFDPSIAIYQKQPGSNSGEYIAFYAVGLALLAVWWRPMKHKWTPIY